MTPYYHQIPALTSHQNYKRFTNLLSKPTPSIHNIMMKHLKVLKTVNTN